MGRDVEAFLVVHHPAVGPLRAGRRAVESAAEAGPVGPFVEPAVDEHVGRRRVHGDGGLSCRAVMPHLLGRRRPAQRDADIGRQFADEPFGPEGHRHRLGLRLGTKPRSLSRDEPPRHPRRLLPPARRRDDGAVVHLHVGGVARPDADRELGAQVEHVGGGGSHDEAAFAFGHPHDNVAVVQCRRQFTREIDFARPLEHDDDAVAEREFHSAADERDPARVERLPDRQRPLAVGRQHESRLRDSCQEAALRRLPRRASLRRHEHPGGHCCGSRHRGRREKRRRPADRRPPVAPVLVRAGG